ncbi:MAG: HAMP domain-containing histidine kinase [Deltaproteobacteria bacterium]|nr:HAMP domain-containing histidine kinase [Deltaproteobacteria bacterium]
MTDRAPRLPLALRLLALGVVQLAVLAVAALAIGRLTQPPAPHDLTSHLDDAVVRVERLIARGEMSAIEPALRELAEQHTLSFTLYDAGREAIASSSDTPVPLPRDARGRPPRDDRGPPRFPADDAPGRGPRFDGPPLDRVPPFDGPPPPIGPFDPGGPRPPILRRLASGHLLVARGEAPPGYVGPLLTALVGLLVIAAGAFFTARWIVRPLERLTEASRKVGQGDLGTRTGISRDDEIGTVARGFDQMAERVEDMLRSERELLANVSHELRTPLARLRVALDLAAEGHTEALADVTADLQELEGIVDDVLLAFRFEREKRSGRTGLPVGTLRETTLEELVLAVQKRFASRHPSRTLELDIDPAAPNVLADLAVLRRAIDNVLDNADKYTPDPKSPITLRVRRAGDRVEIVVEDHGIGIEPADLPRIFEPFFRAERSRVRSAGGVGLGLALSLRIVEAHRGTVEVVSEPGVGTTMTVSLEAIVLPSRPTRSDT